MGFTWSAAVAMGLQTGMWWWAWAKAPVKPLREDGGADEEEDDYT